MKQTIIISILLVIAIISLISNRSEAHKINIKHQKTIDSLSLVVDNEIKRGREEDQKRKAIVKDCFVRAWWRGANAVQDGKNLNQSFNHDSTLFSKLVDQWLGN